MNGYAKQKVPGGKLLSVRLEYNERIEKIEIVGDFFIHPEEALNEIESALLNARADESENEIVGKINRVLESENAEMIGITPESIASTIKMAMKS